MMEILNGREVASKIKQDVKKEVIELKKKGINPKLVTIGVGDDKPFSVYIKNKEKACNEVGILCETLFLGNKVSEEELIELIDKLNKKDDVHGILLQSPVPGHIDINKAFAKISPIKDVDGFNPINVGNLCIGNDCFISCTPFGVMKILEYYNIELEGKNAVVIGRSNIVGKPMIQCLLSKNATVTVCHTRTKDLKEITKNADIIISAIGKPKFVTKDFIRDGAIVIDVGINRTDGAKKIFGDVDFDDVISKVSKITPVPGRSWTYDNCNAFI